MDEGRPDDRGGTDADRSRRRPATALPGLAKALLIAALSPVLPGIAHARAGRIRLGQALLAAQALLLSVAALAAGRGRTLFLELSVRPSWLIGLMAASALLAALWVLLVVHSYAVLVPDGLSPLWQLAGGTTVSVLCLLVIVPPLTVAHYGYLQRDLVAGRSRTGTSDYSRMSRQKCLLWALARQAGPLTVLRSFQQLTHVFKYSVSTDLPRDLLPALVKLAGKTKNAQVTSLQFVPPAISPGRPNYRRMRKLAGRAVRAAGAASHNTPGLHILGRSCT